MKYLRLPMRSARNPQTSADDLRELAKSYDWIIRRAVFMNQGCPLDVLKHVAINGDYFQPPYLNLEMRSYVYENPSTPEEVQLIARSYEFVQWVNEVFF